MFALLQTDENGFTVRETLENLVKRTRDPKRRAEYEQQLAVPPLPKPLAYLYRTFWRIRRRKGGNGFGISPIEWPDIDAFVRNSRFPLAPWEVEIVEQLDDIFIGEANKSQQSKMQSKSGQD